MPRPSGCRVCFPLHQRVALYPPLTVLVPGPFSPQVSCCGFGVGFTPGDPCSPAALPRGQEGCHSPWVPPQSVALEADPSLSPCCSRSQAHRCFRLLAMQHPLLQPWLATGGPPCDREDQVLVLHGISAHWGGGVAGSF